MPESHVRPLLQMQRPNGAFAAIESVRDWETKRTHIRANFELMLGRPRAGTTAPDPRMRVLREVRHPSYTQLSVAYDVEADEEVRAHLLVPHNISGKAPGVLCLHPTSPEAKDTQIGLGGKPNREYALRLVEKGFVCLCPDHLCAGERLVPGYKPYDTAPFYERHPDWSAVGKTIWDGSRALDVLHGLEYVDGSRLGTVGHSLGGHSSIFLAAWDERIQVCVCNCGLTLLEGNPKRLQWSRDHWYKFFPRLRSIFLANAGLPFDMHEIAALIAPRAFLNISALADAGFANNDEMAEVAIELNRVYQLYGQGDRFGFFLFGGEHSVPHSAQQLAIAWLEQWLGGKSHDG